MAFRRRSTTRYSAFPANQNILGSVSNSTRNYKSEGTGSRRHEFISAVSEMKSMALGDYAPVNLVNMKRTFGSSDDEPPTATASNNFQTSQTFNGSTVRGFQAKINCTNVGSSSGSYIDVYIVVTSFADALWLNTVYPSESPIGMTTAGGTPDNDGEVFFKGTHVIWTENTYKNFKGIQRYIHHLGTMFVSSEDGGTPSAEFTINQLPAKVRRMQTGAFMGLFFHYSSSKNSDPSIDLDCSVDIKFDEIPASNRIPFRW